MKKNSIKRMLQLMSIIMLAGVVLVSCKKDDDDDPTPTPTPVEDGIYVVGSGTALTDFDIKGLMTSTKNEVDQEPRSALLDIYVAVKGGDGFNIVKVAGTTKTTYGPGADFAEVVEADWQVDEPRTGKFWRGAIAETETKFTVPEDGLYHVVYDTELGTVVVAHAKWGIIGGATPGGWSDNTPMTAAFDLNKMEFEVTEVTLLQNDWKFRYSDGWKIFMDADGTVKVNTNLGGTVSALEPGGGNIPNEVYGVYTITLTWELGKDWVATATKTGDGEPLPEYPESLYMIGASVGGWDWAVVDLPMIPTHSNPHLFWKIVWIESGVADPGFKFAPQKEWAGDFGVSGEATDGVYAKGSDNVPEPAESGYYMVVVNLLDETIEVNPAKVYGIGDAFGTWDAAVEANLFTVDNANEVIISPAATAEGALRMHVAAMTLTNTDGNAIDWWQAEFNVIDGNIEFRGTGDDQQNIPTLTAGQTVSLNFRTHTGTIQ
ncbi:MAG: SusF/SusE family outer membrane protein [Bacteroidetes bacterium]|nr:SusF/SusE family outer membrane protein [Bacteroidota bacterium]MBU1581076.1 SusF/SusE family outer membrane protein [Bacteroidota bacterium]MBU2557631.1 SusF/SusE family outer membrane protein [Bacteroidota bacterium]